MDRDNRRTIRDVVDGQQRIRTIIDFVAGRFALGSKAQGFEGKKYADLDDDLKDAFLAYKLTCEQLINASDDDVLEVFVRLNSYAVPVNEPELRNAKFENDFSDLVKEIAQMSRPVWELGVLSNRERVRMMDQSLVAEILGFWIHGVTDGGEVRITRLYEEQKGAHRATLPDINRVLRTLRESADVLQDFKGEPIVQRPHFLMLVAAIMYADAVLPEGRLVFDKVPEPARLLKDWDAAVESLRAINAGLSGEEVSDTVQEFVDARSTTQRIKSRQVRFDLFCLGLAGELS